MRKLGQLASFFKLVFLVASALVIACSGRGEHSSTKIIGGTHLEQGDPGYTNLIGFVSSKYDGPFDAFCSGTIISSNLVLTAAHCEITEDDFVLAEDLQHPGKYLTFPIKEVGFHPLYKTLGQAMIYDLSWVRIQSEFAAEYVPAVLATDISFLEKGSEVVFAGLGLKTDNDDPAGERLKVSSVLRAVSSNPFQGERIFTGPTLKHGTCPGDSGGPAFIKHNNQWYLAGVLSGGYRVCEEGDSLHQSVPSILEWLQESSGFQVEAAKPAPQFGLHYRQALDSFSNDLCRQKEISFSLYVFAAQILEQFEEMQKELPDGLSSCEAAIGALNDAKNYHELSAVRLDFANSLDVLHLLSERSAWLDSVVTFHFTHQGEKISFNEVQNNQELEALLTAQSYNKKLKTIVFKNMKYGSDAEAIQKKHPNVKLAFR